MNIAELYKNTEVNNDYTAQDEKGNLAILMRKMNTLEILTRCNKGVYHFQEYDGNGTLLSEKELNAELPEEYEKRIEKLSKSYMYKSYTNGNWFNRREYEEDNESGSM